MADTAALTITAADVLCSPDAVKKTGIAGVAIAAGEVIYLDPTVNELKLTNASASSPANTVAGLALNGAAAGQPVTYVVEDPALNIGAALNVGDTIYASGVTAGVITSAVADVQKTGFACNFLGICLVGGNAATTTVNFNPTAGGVHS